MDAREYNHYPSGWTPVEGNVPNLIDPDGQRIEGIYEVCPGCGGRGRYVNPAIDSHGLSAEDFEDDDFREGYWNGMYDVTCSTCGGNRVWIIPADEHDLTRFREDIEEADISRAEYESERRMGA